PDAGDLLEPHRTRVPERRLPDPADDHAGPRTGPASPPPRSPALPDAAALSRALPPPDPVDHHAARLRPVALLRDHQVQPRGAGDPRLPPDPLGGRRDARGRRVALRLLTARPRAPALASTCGPILFGRLAGPQMTSSVHRGLAGGALLALVAGALFLDGLGRSPLFDPDEARHAEVGREMFEARGVRARLLPTLDYRPYSEKPPAYYWLVALAYRAHGVEEGSARAVSALAALVGVVAIYAYALPRFGPVAALAAGLVTATSGGWLVLSRYA